MNEEVDKFVKEIRRISQDLDVLSQTIGNKITLFDNETVSHKLSIYEDAVDRLKKAFDMFRAEAGNKLVRDL